MQAFREHSEYSEITQKALREYFVIPSEPKILRLVNVPLNNVPHGWTHTHTTLSLLGLLSEVKILCNRMRSFE